MASTYGRRNFLKKITTSSCAVPLLHPIVSPLLATSIFQLSSCATLDDYLFDDDAYLKDKIPIIGGGISGLYLAQLLRKAAIEPRIYEGSSRLGGRVLSNLGLDLGASLFSESDQLVKSLVKEFALSTESFTKQQFSITGGTESLIQEISQRVAGLIPARSLRLNNQLVAINKIGSYYEFDIKTPQGQKTYVSQKVALALPPTQWRSIEGLLKLDSMSWANFWLEQMQTEQIIRVLLKGSLKTKEKLVSKKMDNYSYTLTVKKNGIEADLIFPSKEKVSLEVIQKIVVDELKLNLLDDAASSIFNWQDVKLIQGAYFKSKMSLPNQAGQKIQIIGDFMSPIKPHTLEGALLEAARAAESLI